LVAWKVCRYYGVVVIESERYESCRRAAKRQQKGLKLPATLVTEDDAPHFGLRVEEKHKFSKERENRMHKRIIIAFAVGVLISGWALASDKTDVMAVVKQWNDGFNTGDTKSALAACADQTSIIDDVPPHEWHGAGGCSKWMNDADAFFKKNEMTDLVSTLGKPRHVNVTGDRAYVVVLSALTYTEKGKPVKATATVTMSLQKTASGWRITGWSWADG